MTSDGDTATCVDEPDRQQDDSSPPPPPVTAPTRWTIPSRGEENQGKKDERSTLVHEQQ